MRTCNCSGHCGPQDGGVSRRAFLGWVGAGAATALLPGTAGAEFELPSEDLARWKRDLSGPSAPRLYHSAVHTDARLHLGGIGTGNLEIGADGQLTNWQLFNTLRDGLVPFHFAARCGATARMLQTRGGPNWPRIQRIEMTGEYPVASLRFVDPALPVQITLDAFTPFAPLDSYLSSWPVAAFVFKVHNPSARDETVSLAAFLQNPVGYEASGSGDALAHPVYGGNFNEPTPPGGPVRGGLFLRARPASTAALDRPVHLIASSRFRGLAAPPMDRPASLTQEFYDAQPPAKPAQPASAVFWIDNAPTDLPAAILRAARDLAREGATVVLSGETQPLVSACARLSGDKPFAEGVKQPDIVFEDFERGYGPWKAEGAALGTAPATGTLPNQQSVTGFLGHGLVNTFLSGDDTTGRLTSPEFVITRGFIRFLIGGGRHATTQLRLVLGGKTVRAASGQDAEKLASVTWDVRPFLGKTARLEIVDDQKGPWGHVNVDQIEFSDAPANADTLALLDEMLPVRPGGEGAPADLLAAPPREGATASTTRGGRRVVFRPLGNGRVAFLPGRLLDPAQAGVPNTRQQTWALLCELAGANYTPAEGIPGGAPGFGTLALGALAGACTVLPGFDDWAAAWTAFSEKGGFEPPDTARATAPTPPGRTLRGAVASTLTVPAGQTVEVPFIFAWHYPNKYNSGGVAMGCHYATRWPDAAAVLREATAGLATARARTESFRSVVYDSTLPYWLLDCLTSQAAIIRHIGVVFRIANGDVYGWEGSNGCCAPTCTHVWGYEQTLSRLFPDLERDMRRIDFKHQQRPDGGVNNRTDFPSPPRPTGEHPFADGHASCILKAWREALHHTDGAWMREYWPHARRAVDYLIGRDAASHGGTPAGILEDDQWNTYDEALHGVTTFIGTYYLAALRAGEEWAQRAGDPQTAERFHAVFLKGQRRLVELCWNGEYFQQHLPGYEKLPGEVGPGCMADQLIGQWWAHQLGLGYLLPREHVVTALKSVVKYNWKTDMTGWRHIPRAFAGARDKGLIICTWPKGGRPPHVMLYSDEVWTGIEYQVAAHLIYEGLVEDGYAIAKSARDRYDGVPRAPIERNPWSEVECGGHYARALSSYSLLLAASGFSCDGPAKTVRVVPGVTPDNFKSFFCAPAGWGSLRQTRGGASRQTTQITVVEGQLEAAALTIARPEQSPSLRLKLRVGGKDVSSTFTANDQQIVITPTPALRLEAGQTLVVEIL